MRAELDNRRGPWKNVFAGISQPTPTGGLPMDEFRQTIARHLFRWNGNPKVCVTCSGPVDREALRDELSRREFDISGMCQDCQDATFGREEE